jgi:hypothetical protein
MILAKADGTAWRIDRVAEKLALRAKLPGARVFDLAAESLRNAKMAGVSSMGRLVLALPASWCVNSPAPSTVFRRWVLPPEREVWASLIEVLDEPRTGPLEVESSDAVVAAIQALGPEAFGVEAISKVLALLVPESVPLMPPAARLFALGGPPAANAGAFVEMVNWFGKAVHEGRAELARWAHQHAEVRLSAAQVLDRLLWFDSEGYRHFPSVPLDTPPAPV